MAGVAAPKDPEKSRPYFYIMREKEVFGAKQPSGLGVQFLYSDGGRLINSAKIVGSIEDEEILNLLRTTEGVKKLIHSIGVTAETDDPEAEVDFVFQMYGKKDTYGGGSSFRANLKGNGAETRLYVADHEWTEDDFQPGQIRFEFPVPEKLARVSVRFFLNDGFTAPEVVDDVAVDFTSDNYKTMIERSLVNIGNSARIYKAICKAQAGEDVTLAYIGGSITQGAGATPINHECYAYKSYRAFAEKFGKGDNVHYVKAGVGGTPSELGMIRFGRDVLRQGNGLDAIAANGINTKEMTPDIVFIEFAVNDEGDETKGNCYESLAKKVLTLPNQPAVVLLFSVFADDYNLQERLSPVGVRYDLPMVSAKNAVSPQWKDKENRVISKSQYFYDVFHPTNAGHTIMADCLTNLFVKTVEKMEGLGGIEVDTTESLLTQTPAIGCDFDQVKLLDKKDTFAKATIDCGAFTLTDKELQAVEMDESLKFTPEFPFNWKYDGSECDQTNPVFNMDIECKKLLIVYKDSGAPDYGIADVYLDDEKVLTIDPKKIGWTHCNPFIICNENETKLRHVRIQMTEPEKKFTILGFGYVE